MKESCKITLAGISLVLAAAHTHAQCTNQCASVSELSVSRLYLGADIGAAFQQDDSIRSSAFGNSGKVDYDAGLRAGVHLGYNWLPCFATELETGVIYNDINSINGNVFSNFGASGALYEIPLLVNFIYKPLHGRFQPYVGAGCGGAVTIFDSSAAPLFGSNFNDSDFAFAYQGEVGFKYSVSRHVQLGLAYQFLGTTDHSWSDHGVPFKTDGIMTHSIVATFDWRF